MNSKTIKSRSKTHPLLKSILIILIIICLYQNVWNLFEKDEFANKISTIVALTAILALFKDMILNYIFDPAVQLKLILLEPDCHLTQFTGPSGIGKKAHYFRLRVENIGWRSAEEVEVTLEKVEIFKDGKYEYSRDYMPLPLLWSHWRMQIRNTNIPSKTFRYCDLGFIIEPSDEILNLDSGPVYSMKDDRLLFWFDTRLRPNAGYTYLLPGKYRVEVGVFGKNVQRETLRFAVDWKGVWKEDFQDVVQNGLYCS